jgi:glycerol-3-phosphate dehydrogenase
MKRPSLGELSAGIYDLLIVGGGIVGCGVARDAALRGLRVALVEQHDFGSGTTSRSTRLIHGGLRYLELYDFGLVREDLRERETLMRIAPHLVRSLRFLVPMYRLSAYQRLRLRAGMLLYDALSFDKRLPGHRFLSKDETLVAEPNLDPSGLQGAARYFDAQVALPERLCLENALDAAAHGAVLRNYTRSERFLIDRGRVAGIEVRDGVTGERATVRARVTINATGPWLDRTLAQIRPSAPPLLRTTRGVHLVTERLGPNAVVLFARSDGRLFFVVPWLGLSLIGTTDTDEPDRPENVRADPDDLRYLLDEARRAFPGLANLRPYFSMAGVRALVRKEGVRESEVSRKHAVLDHAREGGPDGVISILGGKITAFRAIAEEAVDLVGRKLGRRASCATDRRPLPGAPLDRAHLREEVARRAERLGLSPEQQRYLLTVYGRRVGEVLALADARPDLADKACSDRPTILAEVIHAAREESALRLDDFLLRRTPLGLAPGQGLTAAPQVAETLGSELDWDAAERAAQVEQYREEVRGLYAVSVEPAEVSP